MSGYTHCACRDCFETVISADTCPALCRERDMVTPAQLIEASEAAKYAYDLRAEVEQWAFEAVGDPYRVGGLTALYETVLALSGWHVAHREYHEANAVADALGSQFRQESGQR